MKSQQIDLLLAKQLSGELKPEDEKELRCWLNANAKNKEEYNKILLTYQLSGVKTNATRRQHIFDRLKSRIEYEEKTEIGGRARHDHYRKWWIAAAAISIAIISATYLMYTQDMFVPEAAEQIMITKKENPSGQKLKVFLPDGSIVWLNSESSLSYEIGFNDSIRFVRLEGEAFFEVKRDTKRPFVVASGSILTTALGTSFNITAFGDQQEVLVSLLSGSVQVQHQDPGLPDTSLVISPGEGVLYRPQIQRQLALVDIDMDIVKAWKDGIMVLQNASIAETEERLERWYGVTFEYRNQPKREWKVNGRFSNEYLENVLNTLSFSYEFDFEIVGKKVYVTFK